MVSRRFLRFFLCCLAVLLPGLAFATASARVDRTAISIDETFQLTVSLDSTSFFSDPDTSVLEQDFTILGRQQSSQSSIINGQRSSVTEWIYQLAPKQAGVFTIPAIDIGGDKTNPVTIKVSGNQNNSSNADSSKPVFMEASVDKQQVYVQEQLVFTLRINTALNLHNLELLQKPEIPDAIMVEVSNTHFERSINNTPYITYEIVYAVFPQASGTLEIPSFSAQGVNPGRSTFNSFFGGGQQVHMQSTPLTVEVLPMPAAAGSNGWLPAKSLALRETWSADPENLQVGDSITRTITTTAEGLSGDQLPAINMPASDRFKTYPDQPVINDARNNQGLVGERKESITLVATQAGDIRLPPIQVQWWDITRGQMQTATLPEVTLKVQGGNTTVPGPAIVQSPATSQAAVIPERTAPAPDTTAVAPASSETARVLPWQIATAISSTLALLFLALLLMQQRKQPSSRREQTAALADSATTALASLKKACLSGDAKAIRLQLLTWAQLNWPGTPVHATSDIALLARDERLQFWLKTLDARLYAHQPDDNGNPPAGHGDNWLDFYSLVEQHSRQKMSGKPPLEPLYPA